jgi:SAM-dependent methyltransferase
MTAAGARKPADYPVERNARLEQEWRAYDEYYSGETLNKPYFYHNRGPEDRFVSALMAKFHIRRGDRLLDIGCGNGFHSRLFADHGLAVTGVDRSTKAIDFCRSHHGDACTWVCDDAFKLDAVEEFDWAFCFWFMYFNAFEDLAQASQDARRLMHYLKPGGTLFFLWHSDLTAVRLPPDRFSVLNYTLPQLERLFPEYRVQSYAVDSPALACRLLGRWSFNKYVTRLSCARVYMQASTWKRARLMLAVTK